MMKVTYSYRSGKFQVPLLVWIQLTFIQLHLYFIRGCRFFKRFFKHLKPLWLIILFAAIFATLSGMLGVSLWKYTVWYEAFWDMRLFFFTSVFLSAMSLVISGEREHHRKLKTQEEEYFEFSYQSDVFFRGVLELFAVNLEFDPFQHEDAMRKFSEKVDHAISLYSSEEDVLSLQAPRKFVPHANPVDCLIFFLEEYARAIERVKNSCHQLSNIEDASGLTFLCEYSYRSIRERLFIVRTSAKHGTSLLPQEVLQFIESLYREIYPIVALLRRPWRYQPDFSLDQKIRSILSAKGQISDNSYNPLIHWE